MRINLSLVLFSFFLLIPNLSLKAQIEACTEDQDFAEKQSLSFYPFEKLEAIDTSIIEYRFDLYSVIPYSILQIDYNEYCLAYLPENGTVQYYKLPFHARLHEDFDYLRDSVWGDLLIIYGYDMNGRTSARFGGGFDYQEDYCALIDLKRMGYYGSILYRRSSEQWSQHFSDLEGRKIEYSILMDTLSDPNYYPEDHLNVHYWNSQEGWDGDIDWSSDRLNMKFKYYSRETLSDEFLDGRKNSHSEGDSCYTEIIYLRDAEGLFQEASSN